MTRAVRTIVFLAVAVAVLFPAGLLCGSVAIAPADVFRALCAPVPGGGDINHFIVVESRLPALATAFLAGASLAVAGLMMQTIFANPLAGPSIMGISAGSSFGVAMVAMVFGGAIGVWGNLAMAFGAFAGAVAVLLVLLLFSTFIRSSDALLIVGILIGYLASSAMSMLNYFSDSEAVHTFVLWGLGTFSGVSLGVLPWLAVAVAVLVGVAFTYSKSLNAMLFGAGYASAAGVSVGRTRTGVLLVSGALTAVVTAYCGPVGFIGLVVPHVARMLTASSDHRVLMPATALAGGLLGLLCQIASVLPSVAFGGRLPVNSITPVLGVPVILYVLLNRRRLNYFN